ncbi:MAG: insulinase family protein [Gemmatimonadaceae bacterium]|nr:insulinase family protein [Gemmatimonadaceae bacterium]
MRRALVAATSALLLGATVVPAQEPAPIRVETYVLTNGLRLFVVEDHTSQVAAVNLWYDVGSRDERPGRTGFAHLFEHMMFQGSEHVAKAEHFQLIERAGGSVNGSTQPDRTDYWSVVPSNRVNLALWLEADRMRSLAVSAENLANQREAVKEERRLRFDNQPYNGFIIDSLPSMFDRDGCFAYGHSIVGSMDDLNAATVMDVREFFRTHYAPNNATIVVAGDVRPAQVRQLVQEYFGDIPAGPPRAPVRCRESSGAGAVTKRITDPNATLAAVLVAYRTVPPSHPDHPALGLLSTILGEGESSRLNRSLVRDAKVAAQVQVLHDPFGAMRDAGVFAAFAVANVGVSADSVQRGLERALFAAADGITTDELEKAKNAWRARTIFARQQALAVTEAVQHAAMFLGSPMAVNAEAARVSAVTVADLRRVARAYMRPGNSLTLLLEPEGN